MEKTAKRAALSAKAVRQMLADACAIRGAQTALAAELGCSVAFVSAVLTGRKAPSGPILRHFGLKRQIVYVPTRSSSSNSVDSA